jgi:crotonobetainyl-CoA:carnitine CoA-transferase CaiB-like acyl-CoA transferase
MADALQDIKVVDLSRILAGPWASQMLADMGAQVIKIEQPNKGDDTRFWGPPFIKQRNESQPPQSAYFHCTNRNKQSIAIDIKQKTGQQIVQDLIVDSDVVIENFKVGGLVKYGLDYPTLNKLNPNLIYCSITGFGQTGPASSKLGYDAMVQAEGGLMSITGETDGAPMKVGVALVDIMAGLYSCNAILAALMARKHIKKGQYIDIALLDVQAATLANQGMNYLATGKNPERHGNGHPNIVPYQAFKTVDGDMILAIGNDSQFQKFCQLSNAPELADNPDYNTNEQRVHNRVTLIPLIAKHMMNHSTDWWVERLEALGVPCGRVNTIKQVFNHEQIKYRNLVKEIPDRNGKLIKTISSPINLSETPLKYISASPDLSQHAMEILSNELDYSDSKIRKLIETGIVG